MSLNHHRHWNDFLAAGLFALAGFVGGRNGADCAGNGFIVGRYMRENGRTTDVQVGVAVPEGVEQCRDRTATHSLEGGRRNNPAPRFRFGE